MVFGSFGYSSFGNSMFNMGMDMAMDCMTQNMIFQTRMQSAQLGYRIGQAIGDSLFSHGNSRTTSYRFPSLSLGQLGYYGYDSTLGIGTGAILNGAYDNMPLSTSLYNAGWTNSRIQSEWNAIRSNSFYLGNGANFNPSFTLPTISSPGVTIGSGSSGSIGGTGATSNKEQAKYQAKLKLIRQYAITKERSSEISAEVNEALKNIPANDYQARCAKLDEIISTFDKTTLKSTIKSMYDSKLTNARTISKSWLDKLANLGTNETPTVQTSSINKNNILDVIGTYISDPKFKNGGRGNMWSVMIKENSNFEAISQKLYNKADDLKDQSPSNATRIENAVNNLKSASEANRPQACYDLFICLREIESDLESKNLTEEYGIPESMTADMNFAKENFEKERNNWASTQP